MKRFYSVYQFLTFIMLFISSKIYASDRFSDDSGVDQILENERYARLDLTGLEWTSIVVGILMIVTGRELRSQNSKVGTPLLVVGGLLCIPLLLIIGTLFFKIVGYAIAFGVIVYVVYALLKN